ncbi:MAG TPA: hypothetical protein VNN18_04850 [Candidatus Xenobia bacterium]|nr:hypothetical protein [Candidatus Xenobia bacterium]
MGLLNPTPGELVDRKTILHLKIEAGRRKQVDVAHFQEELEMIEAALADWLARHAGADRRAYDEATRGLAEINQQLWRAEDDVRALPRSERERLADLAKLIPALNDRRAALVQQVNRVFRVGQVEKLYE